jgi:hypothetical protein
MAEAQRSSRSRRAKPKPDLSEVNADEAAGEGVEDSAIGARAAELSREEFTRLRRILRRKYH